MYPGLHLHLASEHMVLLASVQGGSHSSVEINTISLFISFHAVVDYSFSNFTRVIHINFFTLK